MQCLNSVASGWSPSASAPEERAAALAEAAALLAAALTVPKSSGLRREALAPRAPTQRGTPGGLPSFDSSY